MCVCVCVRALVLRFSSSSFPLALKQKDDDAVLAAPQRPVGRDFFYIYIFFSKKEKRETLVTDAEATSSTIAFVLLTYPIMARFSLTLTLFSLILFSSTRFSFFFFFPFFLSLSNA
jgi:hypothetical protein